MSAIIGPSLYELREALALERLILANLADTIGWEHPAQQSSRARIASLEKVLAMREEGRGETTPRC